MSDIIPSQLSEQGQIARKVLQDILWKMEFPASVEAEEMPEQIILSITSDESLGLLIGKGGQTLNAMESIVRAITQHKTKEYGKRITVDAEGYRQRQDARLEEMAREAANRVIETGESVMMEPMNARDRRIVHMAATEVEGITTVSMGEEPYRRVVICLPGQEPVDR